jgi:hypothetical protein
VTISELGSLGEVIGAVATVATLLYLALQIRANTLAAKHQNLSDIIDRVIRWEARLADSPDLMHSWTAGTKSYLKLQIDEQVRFTSLAFEILATCEATLESAKYGGVKVETVGAVKEVIHQLLRNKGIQEYWEVSGSKAMAVDFVQEVNVILEATKTLNSDIPGPLPFHMPSTET